MSRSTELMLSQTVFAVTNTTVTGDKVPAAAYYAGNKNLQTVTWCIVNMTGTISIQGSLVTNPAPNDWVTLSSFDYVATSGNRFANIVGSYVWLRVVVSNFSQGDVHFVKVSY